MEKVNCDDDISLNPKRRLRFDENYLKTGRKCLNRRTLNVRALFETGKLENLTREVEEINLEILGVTEHKWENEGTITKDKHLFVYLGGDLYQHGVRILMKTDVAKCTIGVLNVSERNMLVKLKARP